MKCAPSVDSSFMIYFSVAVMLLDNLLLTIELLSKLESIRSNPVIVLSTKFMEKSKSFIISTIFTAFLSANSISGSHFVCSSIRSACSSLQVLSELLQSLVTSSGFTCSNFGSLAVPAIVALTSSTEVLNPSKSSMKVGINFFQLWFMLIF